MCVNVYWTKMEDMFLSVTQIKTKFRKFQCRGYLSHIKVQIKVQITGLHSGHKDEKDFLCP